MKKEKRNTVTKSRSTKIKDDRCKYFHHYMIKLFGMECALCGAKVIWEEKVKK